MTTAPIPSSRMGLLTVALRRFRRDEDGGMIVFALVLFTLMLWMGGMAVDLMRYETARTELQNSLDRCTLMATSLKQSLDAEAVVTDCMEKMNLGESIQGIQVVQGMNSRNVVSDGLVDTHPHFLPMMGIPKLDALGHSAALQSITNVEIVLVLDVSGSMSGTKIANLKTAAKEFVATMLDSDPEKRVAISIVPYNAQVNLGPVLRAKYNAVHQHGVTDVNCLEVPASAYSSLALSRNLAIPMMAYADISNSTDTSNTYIAPTNSSNAKPNYGSAFCKPTTVNIVRLPSQNKAALQSQIDALQAGGNTSIMLGMKWGTALLDPSARPMFAELIDAGAMSTTLKGRPFDYTDKESMKVMVVMTDGEHVAHDRITDDYKTGASPIYKSTGDGRYSIRHTTGRPASAGTNQYWVPHTGKWQATAYNSGKGVVQQDWKDIWANLRLTYVAWQFYGRAMGSAANTTALKAMSATFADKTTMDKQLQQSCALAKDEDVIIYGIAFEAPANGQKQILNCASSEAHYFDAQGLGIQTAFRTIASNLTQLKLTQ